MRKRWLARARFKTKLLVGISAIILFTFGLTGVLSYQAHIHLFEEEVSGQYVKANEQAMTQLELRIQELYRISNYIVFNPTVEQIIGKFSQFKEVGPAERFLDEEVLKTELRQVKFDAPQLLSLYLYDMDGVNYYHALMKETVDPLDLRTFGEIRRVVEDSSGEIIWMRKSLPSRIEPSGFRNVFLASRWMRNNSLGMYGMLVMVIDEEFITKTFREIGSGEEGSVYLYDQKEKLLYTDDEKLTPGEAERLFSLKNYGIETRGGESFFYTSNYSPNNNFTLVSRTSLSEIFQKGQSILNLNLMSGLLSIFLSGLLIVLLSSRLLRPLGELVLAMRKVREGNFDTRIETRSQDELGFLADSFNAMASNVNSLIKEVYLSQISEREAELKALQAQLNPHFLYNTLNGLYWKLYLQNDLDTANLVSSLSGLLKYSLERIKKRTTLEEELEQIQNYLIIQNAFVENGFEAEILADDDVLHCDVQRLLLQPLVENAFVHAFRNRSSSKKLVIRAYRLDQYLKIEIADNGKGMDNAQIEEIFSASPGGERESLGIRSVIRRIKLVHGEPYRVEITSAPNDGTTMHLYLPYPQEDSKEEKGA
ncbi:sensor histidine kinase [Paenibacillus sp.]|uniref:sensor histidine kinase n=1 Tax=Paenibacillus sp. TaxID=58172 RepID=UPI0028126B9B|nr:sensor histidine kinase [Paenibacillus sp.]